MDSGEVPDHYFTFEGRLASFRTAQPVRRKSTAKGKQPKALTWPHKQLDPESLARAGFYFDPSSEHPDNVVCFLCQKRVKDWEEDDSPLDEHLRLSPHCGWAIVAAIEACLGDYNADDPTQAQMIEARKATFAGRWPHESKRGWKCKTKAMVDAGWKYTPTLESDDMATCTYCQLALDGWEPSDKPMNEHYRRSPDCAFFRLISQYQSVPAKKTTRGKAARSSKASRLSTQSTATIATMSDAASILDQTADLEDSILTTTSVATQGGTKRGRPKKAATTTKAKRTRAKKDEVVEVLEDPPEPQEDVPAPPPPKEKSARGRKRASDQIEDSVLTATEAPAPKKRATRGRGSQTVESSVLEPQANEDEMESLEAPAPASKAVRKKGRASTARNARKASTVSIASMASTDGVDHLMDDDELDAKLEADLERPLSDDEGITADSDSERKKAPAKGKGKKATTKKAAAKKQVVEEPVEDIQNDHAMFDAPPEIDEAEISAELKTLEASVAEEQAQKLAVPKKGRKAGTRKASKQTTAKAPPPPPVEEPEPEPEPEPVVDDEDEDEVAQLAPATPPKVKNTISPAPAAKQPVVSPSPSAQSSNAENEPPSSKPASQDKARTVLAPVVTPKHNANLSSPSKRKNGHVLSGLQSDKPWSAVDLDMVFEDFDKENKTALSKGSDLTSPEKRMTVEEWIYHNAAQAELKLKGDCEALVTRFEKEGTRAMAVLEALVVE